MQNLTDEEIIELYFCRDQQALAATQQKYGKLCSSIAYGILGSREDAEECLNDSLMKLWESIPPNRPNRFAAFLSVIVRNLACNRRAAQHAEKRGSGVICTALSEIENTLAHPDTPEQSIDTIALSDALNRFLGTLPKETRVIFVLRYWGNLSIKEIAEKCGISQSKTKMTLLRTRNALRKQLEKEELL
ncbi:MAG: RNA polymerase sigma factor [Oscillospiraceae bacterium]|nr:RNA polymerase sigma factor [Oscillospiraceae bacterium]